MAVRNDLDYHPKKSKLFTPLQYPVMDMLDFLLLDGLILNEETEELKALAKKDKLCLKG